MATRTSHSPEETQRQSTSTRTASAPQKPGDGKSSVRARLRQESVKRQRALAPVAIESPSIWETFRTWRRELRQWATGPEGMSLVVSAGVHVLLFMGIALVLYLCGLRLEDHPGDRGPINALFTETSVDTKQPLESLADTEFELTDTLADASELSSLNSESITDNVRFIPDTVLSDFGDTAATLPALPQNALDLVNEDGGNGKSWKRGGFAMPTNKGKVITQGSFSVWTVPEDPEPFKSYKIVIQLNRLVPIRDLREDVTGTVTGTDGYRASIGRVQKGIHFPRQLVIPKARQIAIEIPPAKFELVRDIIEVHSKKLDEKQRIEIVF